ncbi:MAG: hypothetical protein IT439_10190 [Phycisphaerales bacterium]|nr:hypothetical protein [Phycisphaerales bacterium]
MVSNPNGNLMDDAPGDARRPDRAAVVAAWPDLPPVIRAGVLALVKAAAQPQRSLSSPRTGYAGV